jgi:hypothetical protein
MAPPATIALLISSLGWEALAPKPAAPPVAGCQAQSSLPAPNDACEKAPPETPDAPDLGFMKTPSSPAFMALGLAPTTVERPTTPQGAAVAIATGVASATGISPAENFAMELTPYWTFPHPDLTSEELLNQRQESIYRNLSLSLAVVRGSSSGTATTAAGGTALPDTRAAAGLRTTLWPGAPSAAALACQRYMHSYLDGVVERMSATRVEFLKQWDEDPAHRQPSVDIQNLTDVPPEPNRNDYPQGAAGDKLFEAAIQKWKSAILANGKYIQQHDALVRWRAERRKAMAAYVAAHPTKPPADDPMLTACFDRIHDRSGFLADVAGAATLTVPAGNLGMVSSSGQYGFQGWLTGGWVSGTALLGAAKVPNNWSLLGSVHVDHEVTEPTPISTTRLDLGARGIWAWGRFGLWLEGGYRRQWSTGMNANLYKATIGFDFRILASSWLNVVAGKDFGLVPDDKPLLMLANVQWAFGPERKLLPDTTVSQ